MKKPIQCLLLLGLLAWPSLAFAQPSGEIDPYSFHLDGANTTSTSILTIPNGSAPTTSAFGQIAADNDAWGASRGAVQCYDGTANTYLVGVLASDTPSNGQVPTWNTGGTITWETGGGGSGDITDVGNCSTGACFTGSSGSSLTFDNAGGDGILSYDGTDFNFDKSISLGTAGVRLAGDGDGAVTLTGLGNGTDEDLTINLDDVSNTIGLSSSTGVTSIDFGTIGLDVDSANITTNVGTTQVMYSNSGVITGEAAFTYDALTNVLTSDSIFLNKTTNQLVLNTVGVGDITITAPTSTGATITLPGSTSTLMTLGLNETVSGTKTFTNSPAISSVTPTLTFTDTTAGDDDYTIGADADNFTINNTTLAGTEVTIAGATGNVTFSAAIASTTLDTGQGANELYDMDQNVQTTDAPTFTGVTLNGNISFGGTAARTCSVGRASAGGGNTFTGQAGGAQSGSTDQAGGDLLLASGIATGNGESKIQFQTVNTGQGSGTTDRNPSTKLQIDEGHLESLGTAPTMGTCGTTPSIVGNDISGIITTGTGVINTCAFTFAKAYTNQPPCFVTPEDPTTALTAISTTTTLTIDAGVPAIPPSSKIYYFCIGYE